MQRLCVGRTKTGCSRGRRLRAKTKRPHGRGPLRLRASRAPIRRCPAQYGVAMDAVRRRSALQKALVGPAGEHFVLFRLYQHGMLASLSSPGSPTVDVLVLAHDESVIATLQVNTRTGVHMG